MKLKTTCQAVYHATKESENIRSVNQVSIDEGEVDTF